MSKELSPLEALKEIKEEVEIVSMDCDFDKCLDIIETALKRLKNYEGVWQNTNLKQIFISIEEWNIERKKLKVLEIIKEKNVNVYWFRYVHKRHKEVETRPFHLNTLEAYNDGVKVERRLTQEEYELLKEVLL